jgi:hypothetical protein
MNFIISGASSTSWILEILLLSVIAMIIVITAAIIGFLCYKRHYRREQNVAIQLKVLT